MIVKYPPPSPLPPPPPRHPPKKVTAPYVGEPLENDMYPPCELLLKKCLPSLNPGGNAHYGGTPFYS